MASAWDAGPSSRPLLRVVVIGAGFAGLSAARTLATHAGISVTVLEASACAGGRARTGQLPSGTLVEFGATWFHGVRDNPVYDMAVWQGVVKDCRCDPEAQKHEIDWQLHFARPNESQLLSGDLKTIAMEAVGRYTEAAEECTQGEQMGDASVGDVLRRAFDEAVASEGLQGEALNTFADAWHFREKLQRTFDGFFSTDDVSLAFAREYETLEGPNMPIPGGCQGLANILAQGLDIQFNHSVSCIEYGPGGARVTCSNGAVFDCDCVLVTVSLGVLQQRHSTLFHPPLPDWKVDALNALRIGVADKLFVEFEIQPEHAKEAAMWLSTHASASPAHSQNGTSNSLPAGPTPTSGPFPSPAQNPSPEQSSIITRPASSPGQSPSCQPTPTDHQQESCGPLGHGQGTSLHINTKAASHHAGAACASEDSSTSAATTMAAAGPLVSTPTNQWGGMGWRNIPSGTAMSDTLSHKHGQHQQQQQQLATSAGASQQQQRSRRRKHKRAIHSYAFLWPISDPMLLGATGHPALVLGSMATTMPPPRPICCDHIQLAPPRSPASNAALPSWIQGVHSIRYCPGPEWIQPSLLQETNGTGPGEQPWRGNKRSSNVLDASQRLSPTTNPVDGGATHVSGVLWITGNAALEMEQASETQLQEGVTTLFNMFPQVPLPPGAVLPPKVTRTNWGTDPHQLGSYTYINIAEQSGSVVDDLAEPLATNEGKPIVLFAGEATHRQYIGTVHGAFLSGCREAERLLKYLTPCSPTASMGHVEISLQTANQGDMRASAGCADSNGHTMNGVLVATPSNGYIHSPLPA